MCVGGEGGGASSQRGTLACTALAMGLSSLTLRTMRGTAPLGDSSTKSDEHHSFPG